MKIKISGVRKLRERRDRGNPLSAATKEPSGRKAWQEEETRKDISTVLILQGISEFFKDIQEARLLILLYRTM